MGCVPTGRKRMWEPSPGTVRPTANQARGHEVELYAVHSDAEADGEDTHRRRPGRVTCGHMGPGPGPPLNLTTINGLAALPNPYRR